MGAIHQQEALTTDLLQTLKENRGFTPQFLQSQWEAQKTLQLSARAYNDQAGMKKFAKLLEAEQLSGPSLCLGVALPQSWTLAASQAARCWILSQAPQTH
ncbi:uncharacterized protein EI90DRAFT_3124237 [Cantharellus anzutake]|uniref:uncharacterized protein n=1 Tax=Cantharellus anzutake TaxID=1750568 RepID=UPI001908ADF3|nr:uncharacterized protein EI90DRAFT_3124237 [Cantharellus anzutake]KAF8330572.1 hypothetical protein EI90DRAFT_3124237 [Cantharellus anzutake]